MKANDARKLTSRDLTEKRISAVKSIMSGQSPESVARNMSINRVSIYNWLKKYRKGGRKALQARKRGGRTPLLGEKARKWVFKTVATKKPSDFNLSGQLWTIKLIAQVIRERFDIRINKTTVDRTLKELGLGLTQQFSREDCKYHIDYAKQDFRNRVKNDPNSMSIVGKKEIRIFWGFHKSISSSHLEINSALRKSRDSTVDKKALRGGFNMLYSVSTKGENQFMVYRGRLVATQIIDFLKRLSNEANKYIVVFVYWHPVYETRRFNTLLSPLNCRIFMTKKESNEPEGDVLDKSKNEFGQIKDD
jgi:transposase